MTQKQLAKKALKRVEDSSFDIEVFVSNNPRCGGGFDDCLELELSKEQLLYLISERNSEYDIFKGLKIEPFDLDALIKEMTMDAAWPEGGPSAEVNDVIPKELSELSEELGGLDKADEEAVRAMKEKLHQVSEGKYTFSFTVSASDYVYEEDAEESIELTEQEALGLLHGKHELEEVFGDICEKSYDAKLINSKANELGFAENYDDFFYSSDNEKLDGYLNAWDYILEAIMSEEIDEDDLDAWLDYFDDSENFVSDIEEWFNEQ